MPDRGWTKKDRREDAKRRRIEAMLRRERQAHIRRITTYVVVGVLVAGAATSIAVAQRGSSNNRRRLTAAAHEAGCEDVLAPPDQGQGHIQRPQTVHYDSMPPTSGPHWSDAGAPSQTGVHSTQIPDEEQVHNLEHSHVIIHYRDVSSDLRRKLEALVSIDARRIIVEPYATMKYEVAFTAWGHLIGCTSPNDRITGAARLFIATYRGKAGPEGDLPYGTAMPASS